MMGLRVRFLQVQKGGSEPAECDDAWAYSAEQSALAVSDGASDGFECGLLARALTGAFVKVPAAGGELTRWLEEPIRLWSAQIRWDDLVWNAREKARRGAFATLLGVTFRPGSGTDPVWRWRAVAVGDTCLFLLRTGEPVQCFPIRQSADFNNTPMLFSTSREHNARVLQAVSWLEGSMQPGDLMVLATDALAAWFLQQMEAGGRPWQVLAGLTPDNFPAWVAAQRQDEAMVNDDVTLGLVTLDGPAQR